MPLLTINGAAMPAPGSITVKVQDVCASQRRTLSGAASVSRAAVKRTIACQWPYLPGDALSLLLSAVTNAPLFELSYPDPQTGDMRSVTAYCTERSVGLARMHEGTPVWTQIAITFTEV